MCNLLLLVAVVVVVVVDRRDFGIVGSVGWKSPPLSLLAACEDLRGGLLAKTGKRDSGNRGYLEFKLQTQTHTQASDEEKCVKV